MLDVRQYTDCYGDHVFARSKLNTKHMHTYDAFVSDRPMRFNGGH
jgi:hypothetical protein